MDRTSSQSMLNSVVQGSSASSPYLVNTSLAIRQEIQRFESVHPSIYAIYDLIELIPDPLLAQQIREHVVCIEDSFVNSQEWTLSRSVPDIRLGIVGSLSSGKSALVHRYLTGSYMQEESPEGGRFKKEIVIDGQSYLLLIRDEGGPPELQFTSWVDAVIFVFSLENETSFNAIYNYYAKMSQFRNMQEIPLILVGTQDSISENHPRVIDDARARKLANDLKRCSYYETCATYGLNVERVFQDACQKLCQTRHVNNSSRPTTPNNHFMARPYPSYVPSPTTSSNGYMPAPPPSPGQLHQSPAHLGGGLTPSYNKDPRQAVHTISITSNTGDEFKSRSGYNLHMVAPPQLPSIAQPPGSNNTGTMNSSSGSAGSGSEAGKFVVPAALMKQQHHHQPENGENKENKELPTPSSTPTTSRKNRRRSNLFTPSKKTTTPSTTSMTSTSSATGVGGEEKSSSNGQQQMGSGRSIPIRQGILYKKSNKSFSKDWKKKYVTLCDDGRMTYHPSLHDYMDNVHGKEISLQYVTVKVPGQKPRGSRTIPPANPNNGNNGIANDSISSGSNNSGSNVKISSNNQQQQSQSAVTTAAAAAAATAALSSGQGAAAAAAAAANNNTSVSKEKVMLTGYEMLREPSGGEDNEPPPQLEKSSAETPNVKKRHRRMKSNGVKAGNNDANDDGEAFEFHIVSLDNKQWYFEASSAEERDEWVASIEQQILNSLQGNESSKSKQTNSIVDLQAIKTIKSEIPGNNKCVDCDAPNPDWASINLGVLMCIQCSGVHRNLGSHISRVRSLDLDEWPPGHLAVMTSLGNQLANSNWEAHLRKSKKPCPNSSQEEKEMFIMAKYNRKEFLAPLPPSMTVGAYLVDAICRSDMKAVTLALAHAKNDEVNSPISPRDDRSPLHLASSLGNLAIAQLLIWSNANVKGIDHDGRTCVSYARNSCSSQELLDLLLNNGCPDVTLSGTLPRRKNSVSSRKNDIFEKITSSVL